MPLVRKPPPHPPASQRPAQDASAVLRALANGDDDERWAAARAAAEMPASVPALGAALTRERNARVREALFSALARIANAASVEAVLPFLRSDDAALRAEATDALVAMREAAWPNVQALLHDADHDVRILACTLVREMPQATAVRLCCEALDAETHENVCGALVDALSEVGDSSALPALVRCAERFRATPFLTFSVNVAIDRLRSQPPSSRD